MPSCLVQTKAPTLDKNRARTNGFKNLSPTAIKIFENSKLPFVKDVVSLDRDRSRKAVQKLVDMIFSR